MTEQKISDAFLVSSHSNNNNNNNCSIANKVLDEGDLANKDCVLGICCIIGNRNRFLFLQESDSLKEGRMHIRTKTPDMDPNV